MILFLNWLLASLIVAEPLGRSQVFAFQVDLLQIQQQGGFNLPLRSV